MHTANTYSTARGTRRFVAILNGGFRVLLVAAGFGIPQTGAAGDAARIVTPTTAVSLHQGAAVAPAMPGTPSAVAPQVKRADFAQEHASVEARHVADWVVDAGDNKGLPFVIVDKQSAKVFVFDSGGRLRGSAAALLGLALGDDAVPGIGNRPLSSIRPEERTTPAGRFDASLGRNLKGGDILWVDYDTAISMHPVINTNVAERRPQRLNTPSPLDNRISFGCINVPVNFFQNVVRPAFTGTNGIVYVLPDIRPASAVFASYDVIERARLRNTSHPAPTQTASALP